MKNNLKNFPDCTNCPKTEPCEGDPESCIEDWVEGFEKELREKLAEATKEWDDLGLICADLRRDIFKEILGETEP